MYIERVQPCGAATALSALIAACAQRYALLLSAEERDTFQPLRGHYEVNFYLQQAEAANQQQQQQQQQQPGSKHVQQHLSSTVKNRRLAFMRRLEQQGEYFTEHAMRQREPLVWQECIGTLATGLCRAS
mgnify:CR=1 FL=1